MIPQRSLWCDGQLTAGIATFVCYAGVSLRRLSGVEIKRGELDVAAVIANTGLGYDFSKYE
jgi:hypothetical protein